MAATAFVIGFIAKRLKRETVLVPFVIAMCGLVEFLAILMQMYLCFFYLEWKYLGFCAIAWIILMILNIANYVYIQRNVLPKDAEKWAKLSKKKRDALIAQ